MPLLSRFRYLVLPAMLAFAASASAQSLDHARQLFDDAKYGEARSELAALQKSEPRNAVAAYSLGRIASRDNDGGEAVRQLERAVDLDGGSALYHAWLGNAIRDETIHASKFRQPFMARRVMKEWTRALELDPGRNDTRLNLVMFYVYVPGFMGGGMDRAREQTAELGRRSALHGALARAMIANHGGDPAVEAAAYEQAVAAAPDSIVGYVGLADVHVRDSRPAESFAAVERYAKRRPDDRWVLFHVGRLAGASGEQLDRGDAALKQFLSAPPTEAPVVDIARAHYALGQIAQKRGATDVAREHYAAALKLNPNSRAARRALDALE